MFFLKKFSALAIAVTLLTSLLAAPALANEVVNLGKCERRGEVVVAKGIEYKCSISGASLKWKKVGIAKGTGVSATSSNDAAYKSLTGKISIDGSSTVAPLTGVAAEAFQKISQTQITVGISGTGGGFSRFCKGETDISNASRPIKSKEAAECEKNGIKHTELIVANDALTVVVNKANSWASCLTTAELKAIWNTGSKVTRWNQVRASFPNIKMVLYGAGTDSGTFDYFTEAINGKAQVSRKDFNPTEDDNVTVNGVRRSKGAIGYYGLSYYLENTDINKAVQIDGGKGCVEPSAENVINGTYKPLGRPLFIYIKNSSAASNKAMIPFLTYYEQNLPTLAKKAQFVQLSSTQQKKLEDELAAIKKLAG
ncbi:MAG: PstS family phosphate ABC transporter substrate-binding protein [Actinomycetota bacterium]|nr:PstS family phosphate ABC transporter substrate-binding protein [Actinomycetota bacterium]